MKSYEEVAQEVLERRDEYLREKRRRKRAAGKAVSATAGLCVGILALVGIWRYSAADSHPAEGSPSELAGNPADPNTPNDSFPQGSYKESLTGASNPPGTVGAEELPAGSAGLPVSYSSLLLPAGEIKPDILAQYESGLANADILPFEEDMLSDCCAILEGTITDMYLKHYSYDTYDDKFGSREIYHNQTSSVVYELTVSKVWYGDQSLSGKSVLIEDEIYLMDSYFSLKTGRSYVIPLQDAGETKQVWRYADGDLTKDSRYATLYPYHPQIEVTLDGNYMVTSDWESLCTEDARDILLNPDSAGDSYTDTFVEYHPKNQAGPDGLITTEWRTLLVSKNDAVFYYNRLKLIKSGDFFIQLNLLIDQLP